MKLKPYKSSNLKKAEYGHYWVKIPGNDWDVGRLWGGGGERFFSFRHPSVYGAGSFGLGHEALIGAEFIGPIARPMT